MVVMTKSIGNRRCATDTLEPFGESFTCRAFVSESTNYISHSRRSTLSGKTKSLLPELDLLIGNVSTEQQLIARE
jgi:hypothetical protein